MTAEENRGTLKMRITVICAGGTIDKDYSCALGGYNFEVGEPAIKRLFDKLQNINLQYTVQSVLRKDSLDMTPQDRKAIRKACRECDDDHILVTHGTDTMLETAAALSGVVGKTIVMTGAMRPEKFTDSDAQFNFGLAVGALNVLVAGKDMGTIEMPDARAYRAGAIMNSQIKFKSFSFTGTELPGCDFEHPGLAADLMGPYRVSVQYFDRDFNEVTEAARPGRYGAVVTVEIKNRRFRRFHTLYCASTEDRPLRVHARRIEVKADISLPPGLGIDPAVVKENAGVLERSVRRRFQEEIENDPEIAVILAGLSEARPGDKTDIFSDLFARERQWWVTMKRKFYGLDKRYPEPLDPPRAIDGPPATTIREGTAAEAGVKPDAAEKIDAMLNQWAGDTDEAFAVCIVRRGVIVLHKAYGKRGGKPMTLETTSNMASITKMLGGVLTMMCVDQGRLDLEAPLDKVHPAFAGIDVATPATIRLLYSHWSGLSGHQGGLRNDLEEMVASYYPHLEVNKRYEYCSLDCALVGKFVEAVSGEALPQFYKRHLIDPLGLKHTEVTRMGFGTRSIPMDMARIGQMLLNRGAYGTRRFFSEETFRKMLPVGDRRGIGTVSLSESGLSDRTFGHPGASKATIRIDPENDLVIVMCRNSEGANYDKYHGKFIQTVVDGLAKE